jgi:uncharacterized protein (TIGR00730 family)
VSGLSSICVFCGSSTGSDPSYARLAESMGQAIAERELSLVYGGAKVGLMGVLADAALTAGGEVFGVLPRALQTKELAHSGLTRLEIVESMHQRKARMVELADAFVALPGGAGTLEEICEIWTWAQLGFHQKPAGFLNFRGYYDGFLGFIDHAVGEAFVRPAHRDMLIFKDTPGPMLDALEAYSAPQVSKWVERAEL